MVPDTFDSWEPLDQWTVPPMVRCRRIELAELPFYFRTESPTCVTDALFISEAHRRNLVCSKLHRPAAILLTKARPARFDP